MRCSGTTTSSIFVILMLPIYPLAAQEREQDAQVSQQNTGATNREEAQHRQMMEQSKQMEQMAKSMTSMAQMCETMMKAEMKNKPLFIAAVSITGGLVTIALLLFIVLEVEWIRDWHRRLRSGR